jgi:protein SCO1/2
MGAGHLTAAVRLLLLSVCTPFFACGGPTARQYELRGQILAIRPEASEVLIKHGDIQNFMPGMTMPFKVRDATLLDGKAGGDLVTAQLMVGENDAWLSAIEKTGSAPLETVATIPPASFVTPLAPGDPAPDTELANQDGKPVSLKALRPRAVAITFIYVRCPMPEFCPLMDRRFADVQRQVAADASLGERVHLLSVSFDPDQDTPAELKAHAGKLVADPARWTFATAPRETVDRFAAAFGVNVIREADRTITHNLRTAVIGPDGKVVAIYTGSDWSADQLVGDLKRALQPS